MMTQPGTTRSAVGGLFSSLILPVVAAIVTSFIVTSNPNIPDSAAHAFLDNYYSSIVNSHQRQDTYNNYLTLNFRSFPNHSWPSVNEFFGKEKQVTIIIPISGNANAFAASLSYYPRSGGKVTKTTNFYLVCNDFWRAFPSCHARRDI